MKRHSYLILILACMFMVHETTYAQNNRGGRMQTTRKTTQKKPSSAFPGQFPESSERLVTAKDVEHQTDWGMKVMLNEIYARQGYIFRDADLRKHFRKEKWYKGKERNFSKIKLTPIEIQNIAFIKQQQQQSRPR